ncbi:hypothetical protein Tco_0276900 [Tanacetum coccineum]
MSVSQCFVQHMIPDYVPDPIYTRESKPLEDEHKFSAEEQPILPIDSPTAESPGHVTKSDPEENPDEYEDDETEDGPVDYPMGQAEVERLLGRVTTPSPSPPISLSPPSAGERLARCTAPPAHSSPLLPSSGCPTQIQTLRIASTQALIDASLCFRRGLGSLDRDESGDSIRTSDPTVIMCMHTIPVLQPVLDHSTAPSCKVVSHSIHNIELQVGLRRGRFNMVIEKMESVSNISGLWLLRITKICLSAPSVKSARPKTLVESIELDNDLMDQKLRTYTERQSDNKRKADDSSRNNHGHQVTTLQRGQM